MKYSARGILIILFFPSFNPSLGQVCYLPNGVGTDVTFSENPVKCPNSNTCCFTNRTNPPGGDIAKGGFPRDECLPNGLCQYRGYNSTSGSSWQVYFRNFCAVSTWDGCLNICLDGKYPADSGRMTPCDGTNTSETWCCGGTPACCNGPNAVNLASVLQSSTTSGYHTTSTSVGGTGASTPGSSTDLKPGLSKGAKVGIGVGAAIGGVACLALVGFFYVKFRRLERRVQAAEAENTRGDDSRLGSQQIQKPELMASMPQYQKPELMASMPNSRAARHELAA